MAAIALTPEGKYILSRNAKFQQSVLQAATEKARDIIIANVSSPPNPWKIRQAKLDAFSRRVMSGQVSTQNIESIIYGLLAKFDNPQIEIDPDNQNVNVLLLYTSGQQQNNIDEWFEIQAGVNTGDNNINVGAGKYPPLSEYA